MVLLTMAPVIVFFFVNFVIRLHSTKQTAKGRHISSRTSTSHPDSSHLIDSRVPVIFKSLEYEELNGLTPHKPPGYGGLK